MNTRYSKTLALKNNNSYSGDDRYWFERNDCSVIAIAYAFDIPYLKAHELCAKYGRKDCNGFDPLQALKVNKYKKSRQMFGCRVGYHGRPKMTVGRFQIKHPTGTFLIRVGGHVFTMIDGKLFNQSGTKDIISYYCRITATAKTPLVSENEPNICEEQLSV